MGVVAAAAAAAVCNSDIEEVMEFCCDFFVNK